MNVAMVITHRWERFGYKAPYRITGLWSAPSPSLAEQNPSAYNAALASAPSACRGTCDVCGIGITHHYMVKDSTGKVFAVGSDCVLKADDTKLISEMRAIKNKAARDAAKAKRDAQRIADMAAAEADREAQRQRNGGLTDYEVEANRLALEKEEKRLAFRAAHPDLVAALEHSDFGQSILVDFMYSGKFPQNRAFGICADIFAKHHGGRSGSKANQAQYDRFVELYRSSEGAA